ncbi:MAG: CPBP family intramembrane metalloprotease [Anaerolineae bacterium]|nr:CPBP family intramembrane metalloprotease [Anaerolineae bacterium]
MESLIRLFWNPAEKRLRMAWRLLIQQVGHLAFSTAFSVPLVVVGLLMAAAGGDGMEDLLTSPLMLYANGVVGALSTVLLVWLLGSFIDKRRFSAFGFRFTPGWWVDFGFGLFLGAALMALVFFVERSLGWVEVRGSFAADGGNFLLHFGFGLLTFLAVGFYEELLFRGYQLKNMAEGLNGHQKRPRLAVVLAIVLTSVGFGLAHFFNPNASVVSTLNIALAGIFLGMGYILTGELAIPIGVHITWNFFQGVVFGFPVSGMMMGARVVDITQGGPQAWTGGAFGPEAGYIGLLAILLGSLLTMLYVRLRYGSLKLHLPLTVYEPRRALPTAVENETLEEPR